MESSVAMLYNYRLSIADSPRRVDRISSMPGELIGHILSRMPIKDAVRTSILSSKWRYKWTKDLYQLQFDELIASQYRGVFHVPSMTDRLVKVIDSVLLQHSAPIKRFSLCHRDFQGTGDADKWIRYLSKASINELVFSCSRVQPYKMPSHLFQCQDLVFLFLENCSLRIPPTFQGFQNLGKLRLSEVALSRDSLEKLISSCPLLTTLNLNQLLNITHLNIDAPNLKVLDLQGALRDVSFRGKTDYLFWVRVCFTEDIEYRRVQAEKYQSNMCKFFADLLHIESLTIDMHTLRYLSAGNVPATLPIPLDLTYLSLRINLHSAEEFLACLCLLRSSPSLEDVKFLMSVKAVPANEDRINYFSNWAYEFTSIKYVSVSGIRGSWSEMGFLKFLLSNCPKLERMVVRANSSVSASYGGYRLVRDLLQLERASTRAKVTYLEHNDP